MALSARLRAYLAIEAEMLELDRVADPAADPLRDAMDPLWFAMTPGEHAWLDARPLAPSRPPRRQNLGARPLLSGLRLALSPQPGFA